MSNKQKKVLSAATICGFIISLLPLLFMCRYVHASGDDYGYGALTHAAWLDTGSIVEVLKAAANTVINYYYGWQGTWSTIFLFSLQPEVFFPNGYWIVPILMIGLTIAGTTILVYHLLVTRLALSKLTFLIINCSLLFAMIQFVPRTKSALFWYNGCAHYVIPYFWAVIAIYCSFKFVDTYKFKYWLITAFMMFFLGGASYLAALLAPIILVYILLIYAGKRPKSLWLIIPLLIEGIGLIISMKAPGNIRRGGESLALSAGKVIETILECFQRGFLTFLDYLQTRPVSFVVLFFIAIVLWDAYNTEKINFEFKRPFLFAVLMFCTWCAMFAPEIYANTEVSGGVPNTVYYVFMLTSVATVVYLLGWFHKVLDAKRKKSFVLIPKQYVRYIVIPAFALCAILVIHFRSEVRGSTMFQCIEYVVSGQAEDYRDQMDERLAILLDDTQREVELYQINAEQGPLMHMEVLADPEAWTNEVCCQFFRKDKVVGGLVRP